MCAVAFCVFSFCWLFWFQADALTVAQHQLSGGTTHYDRTVGAVLITLVLTLLQLLTARLIKLYRNSHALTYLPSFLLLALLSDISSDADGTPFLSGCWYWAAPLLLLLWGGLVWLARQLMPFQSDKKPSGVFSRRAWINLLLMALMMFGVSMVGNTNAVYLYRAHVENALRQGDVEEALRTGRQSDETDVSLTMLRAYALSLRGELGDRLFDYPVEATGNDLLPLSASRSRLLLLSPDSLFLHLGALPKGNLSATTYYNLLERDTLATRAVADYRLCGLLIDRKLDAFIEILPRYYAINDSLPRHYKEALTLYVHQRSQPVLEYDNAILEEDWQDFQRLENSCPTKNEREGKVRERYATSYWYYFFY